MKEDLLHPKDHQEDHPRRTEIEREANLQSTESAISQKVKFPLNSSLIQIKL